MTSEQAGHEWRGYIYALLGLVYYRQPGQEFIKDLAARDIFSWSFLPLVEAEAAEGASLLAGYLKPFRNGVSDAELEHLQCDYFRMFIGAGMPEAPPWESFYRTEERVVFSEYTVAVRAQYESFGLVSELREKEPDDHIGLELEFMGHLCDIGRELLVKGDEEQAARTFAAQRGFMDEHLLQWAPRFCGDVCRVAQTPYFVGIAKLTKSFLDWDRRFLSDMVDQGSQC